MTVVKLKPTSPGRRSMVKVTTPGLHKGGPEQSLIESKVRSSGRNNHGRITVRHRGGGHKQLFRVIDFKRDKENVPAKVATIEYDPNRSARIALLHYVDGEKRYILAPSGIAVGDMIVSSLHAEIRPGNCLPLKAIPQGSQVHNVEIKPGHGGQLVRSAGSSAQACWRASA